MGVRIPPTLQCTFEQCISQGGRLMVRTRITRSVQGFNRQMQGVLKNTYSNIKNCLFKQVVAGSNPATRLYIATIYLFVVWSCVAQWQSTKKLILYTPLFLCSVRLTVRTCGFRPHNRGSIPRPNTNTNHEVAQRRAPTVEVADFGFKSLLRDQYIVSLPIPNQLMCRDTLVKLRGNEVGVITEALFNKVT